MRILDQTNQDVHNPDFSMGYLKEDKLFIAHHPAIAPIEEQWHYEVIEEFPNGGRTLEKVIDSEGVSGVKAWDEYEKILRFIPYTEEEAAEVKYRQQQSLGVRVSELEEVLMLLLSGDVE